MNIILEARVHFDMDVWYIITVCGIKSKVKT